MNKENESFYFRRDEMQISSGPQGGLKNRRVVTQRPALSVLTNSQQNMQMLDLNFQKEKQPNRQPLSSPKFFRSRYKNDPQFVTEYSRSIFQKLKQNEMKHSPREDYMKDQKDITPVMRSILVDWLIDVHLKFKMNPETLYLSVNILDRYMSKKRINRKKLQLVGIVSLFIAAKYEEIYIPSVTDLESVCAFTYNCNEILSMERRMLTVLKFCFTVVTPETIFRRLLYCLDNQNVAPALKKKIEYSTMLLTEICMMGYDFLSFTPSMIASTCIYLAGKLLMGNRFNWDFVLQYYSGFEEHQIQVCMKKVIEKLKEHFENTTKLTAVRRKYSSAKRERVSFDLKKRLRDLRI